MVGWQEGHPACKNPDLQRFSSGTCGGGPEGNHLTPTYLDKTAVKWKQ